MLPAILLVGMIVVYALGAFVLLVKDSKDGVKACNPKKEKIIINNPDGDPHRLP